MKKIIWNICIGLGVIFVILCILIIRPVAAPSPDNLIDISGEVIAIHEGGPHDVVFRLKNDKNMYYINRGMQHYGLKLDELSERLVGKNTDFKYIKHWSLLNYDGHMRPIAFVKEGEEVIFTRLKEKIEN